MVLASRFQASDLGIYYLGAIADNLGAVAESNEANNTRVADTGQVTITPGVAETVSVPFTPTGPGSGTVGTSYSFVTGGAISSLGHSVQYLFDYGDGTNSGWLPVGTVSALKTWGATGTYPVKAQARCSTDTAIVSGLSGNLNVTISVPPPPGCSYSISPASNTYGRKRRDRECECDGGGWVRVDRFDQPGELGLGWDNFWSEWNWKWDCYLRCA